MRYDVQTCISQKDIIISTLFNEISQIIPVPHTEYYSLLKSATESFIRSLVSHISISDLKDTNILITKSTVYPSKNIQDSRIEIYIVLEDKKGYQYYIDISAEKIRMRYYPVQLDENPKVYFTENIQEVVTFIVKNYEKKY